MFFIIVWDCVREKGHGSDTNRLKNLQIANGEWRQTFEEKFIWLAARSKENILLFKSRSQFYFLSQGISQITIEFW
jgi:hypothetical protein